MNQKGAYQILIFEPVLIPTLIYFSNRYYSVVCCINVSYGTFQVLL